MYANGVLTIDNAGPRVHVGPIDGTERIQITHLRYLADETEKPGERERCAKIAESFSKGTEPPVSVEMICFYIAREIRGQSK